MNKLEKMAQNSLKAWNAHDADKVASEFADDGVFEDVPSGQSYRGKAEVKTMLSNQFSAFPDLKIEFKSVVTSGERIATEWVATATFKGVLKPLGVQPTGKAYSMRGVSMVETRGDKIKRFAQYYDSATTLRQLGITAPAA